MADTNHRGPINAMGALEVDVATSAQVLPLDGPSMFYQGIANPDIRSAPFAKDGFRPGQQAAFLQLIDFFAVDGFPQAASTGLLAASATATAATGFALTTAQLNGPAAGVNSIAIGVPIIPQGTTVVTTAAIALDFGFATGTTVAGSTAVVVNDNTLFSVNQWIVVGGAANSGATASLIAMVAAINTSNTTGISLDRTAGTGLSHTPIGAANLFGSGFLPAASQFGPSAPVATGHTGNTVAGLARIHNPREMIARAVSVTAGTTTATSTITVRGWDVWRQAMSEDIVIPSGNRSATTFFGSKAFKYISSATPSTTAVGNISLGLSDVFGLPMRSDRWEYINAFWNGCSVPTSLGFTAAGTTSPATNTTGDVRGTLQVSTNGTGTAAAVATAAVSNGTARLTIVQNAGVWNTLNATPINTVPMFGVNNSTS